MGKLLQEFGPFLGRILDHRWRMLAGAVLNLLAIISVIGLLALAGWFLSAAAVAGTTIAGITAFNFFLPSVGVRLFAFTRTLARYAERIVCHDVTFRILQSLRVWFFKRLAPLIPAVLGRYRSGDILNRLVEDVDILDNLYLRVLSPSLVAATVVALLSAMLWRIDPAISAGALGLWLLAGAVVPVAAAQIGARIGAALASTTAALRSRVVDTIQGLPALLIYDTRWAFLQSVATDSRALLRIQYRLSHLAGLSAALLTLCAGLAVPLVLYLGVDDVAQGRLSGPGLALVVLAVMAAFEALWPLPKAFQYLDRTRKAARRLQTFASAEAAVAFPAKTAVRPQRFGLKIDRLSFGYPGSGPVLRDFNLDLAHGERLALLGPSGCGKSTLIHLLARFWDPDAGRITIGGVDIATLAESDLRRCLSVVSQQAHIFNTTLRENMLLAKPDASAAQLEQALDRAQLLRFVQDLPDGLDTLVGEAGRMLSGGQAQRLAVARAFLHDAPIWVLDEPTEGLDSQTAETLCHSILQWTVGKTLLWVTHRRFGLAQMDQIALLEDGRIGAIGAHDALLTQNRRYRDLHQADELV